MTPPVAPVFTSGNTPPAVSSIEVLRKRADFLALNKARRQSTPTMMVQGRDRKDGRDETRVGFTCSKKVGNAIARNRAKRRLREVARTVLPQEGRPGWDYALIGRAGATGEQPFEELLTHFRAALRKLHESK